MSLPLPRRPLRVLIVTYVVAVAGHGMARGQVVVRQQPAAPVVSCPAPAPRPLGNFEPQPYTFLPSNGIGGGGYSSMNLMNAPTLAEYGPLSMYRQVAVPMTVYSRGYNGAVVPTQATGLVYPNLPAYSPVNGRSAIAFPPSRNYYRPFVSGSQAMNWIDQN